jgi:hypothetical protein
LGCWASLSYWVRRKINRKTCILGQIHYSDFISGFFNTYASIYSNLIVVQINFVLIELVCSSSCIWCSAIVHFINFNKYTLQADRVKIMDN